MAISSIAASNITTSVTSFSSLILVTPQTNGSYLAQDSSVIPGLATPTSSNDPYVFNYEGENAFSFESDITDSYIESNSAIQDHIALKPETFKVQGFVGELNDILPIGPANTIKQLQSKLVVLSAYAPSVSVAALEIINEAILAEEVAVKLAASALQTLSTAIGGGLKTQQSYYFNQFYLAWQNRTLFTIQTPWTILSDMAIQSVQAIQDESTRMVTDFEITFKAMRFVNPTSSTGVNPEDMSGRAATSATVPASTGTNTPFTAQQSYGSLVPSAWG